MCSLVLTFTLIILFLIKIIYFYFMDMCTSPAYIYTLSVLDICGSKKQVSKPLGSELKRVVLWITMVAGYWEPNAGPLQEQQVFF